MLSKEVTGAAGERKLTNEDLALVRAQLRAAAHSSNLRAIQAAEAEQRELSNELATSQEQRAAAKTTSSTGTAASTGGAGASPNKSGGGKKMSRKSAIIDSILPPSDATTCAAAIETLLWFGLALGDPVKKSSSSSGGSGEGGLSGSKHGAMASINGSFVDLEQLSVEFDAHEAAKKSRKEQGSASSSAGTDPLPDSSGFDDVELSNWDWVTAMSETQLHEDGEEALTRSQSSSSSRSDGEHPVSAAERKHPLTALDTSGGPPQPSDLLGQKRGVGGVDGLLQSHGSSSAASRQQALGERFESEEGSEVGTLSEEGGQEMEITDGDHHPHHPPPTFPSVGPMMSSSSDVGGASSADVQGVGLDALGGTYKRIDVSSPVRGNNPSASPYASPPRRSSTTGGKRKEPSAKQRQQQQQQQAAAQQQQQQQQQQQHEKALDEEADAAVSPDSPAGRSPPQQAGSRRSSRPAKPKSYFMEELEQPLLKWEKEQKGNSDNGHHHQSGEQASGNGSGRGKKRPAQNQQQKGLAASAKEFAAANQAAALAAATAAGRNVKRRLSQDSSISATSTALYETDGEISPGSRSLGAAAMPAPETPSSSSIAPALPRDMFAAAFGASAKGELSSETSAALLSSLKPYISGSSAGGALGLPTPGKTLAERAAIFAGDTHPFLSKGFTTSASALGGKGGEHALPPLPFNRGDLLLPYALAPPQKPAATPAKE